METKFSAVTHADRIEQINNLNYLKPDNKNNIQWGKLLTITVICVIAMRAS
jgi:hypothetical protein